MKPFLLLTLTALMLGCVGYSQRIELQPAPFVHESRDGTHRLVRVVVEDKRPAGSFALSAAEQPDPTQATTRQSLSDALHEGLATGLRQYGFETQKNTQLATHIMLVDIERFEFTRTAQTLRESLSLTAKLKVRVNYHNGWFEKSFASEREEKSLVFNSRQENQTLVNSVLNDLLNRVLEDQPLRQALNR